MQNCLGTTNGFIKEIYINSLKLENKIENVNNHNYCYHKNLSDIDEEDPNENNSINIYNSDNKASLKYEEESSHVNEPLKNCDNGSEISHFCNTTDNISDKKSKIRVGNLFQTNNFKRILNNRNSKQNKSLSTKSLCKRTTLSSMIDIEPNHSAIHHYNPSRPCPTSVTYPLPSLATSQIDLTLSVNNDSIVLGKMSSIMLNQSKSYLKCSTNSSTGNFLFSKVHKSQNTNSLIAKTKSRILLLENNELHHLESHTSFNDSKNSFPQKTPQQTINKFQSNKFLNQNFKLDFSQF